MWILIIADSRGYGLVRQISATNWLMLGFCFEIMCLSGATIRKGISDAIARIGNAYYDVIYVYLGVNNLSLKIRFHKVAPVFSSRYDLVKSLMREFYESRQRLRTKAKHVIICELSGLYYGTYNMNASMSFPLEQIELNSGIILLNEYIRSMNNERYLYCPNIADHTHKQRKERDNQTHRYSASMYDRLHFTYQSNEHFMDRFIPNVFSLREDMQL